MCRTLSATQIYDAIEGRPEVLRGAALLRRKAYLQALDEIETEIAEIQEELDRKIPEAQMRRGPIVEVLSHLDAPVDVEGWLQPGDDILRAPHSPSGSGKTPKDAATISRPRRVNTSTIGNLRRSSKGDARICRGRILQPQCFADGQRSKLQPCAGEWNVCTCLVAPGGAIMSGTRHPIPRSLSIHQAVAVSKATPTALVKWRHKCPTNRRDRSGAMTNMTSQAKSGH